MVAALIPLVLLALSAEPGPVTGIPSPPGGTYEGELSKLAVEKAKTELNTQLEAALKFVGSQESGAVIYLKQEGRGIGLLNKIKAYQLQELGLDKKYGYKVKPVAAVAA